MVIECKHNIRGEGMKLSIFGKSKEESSKQNKDYKTVTYSEIEHAYDKGEFVDSALMFSAGILSFSVITSLTFENVSSLEKAI